MATKRKPKKQVVYVTYYTDGEGYNFGVGPVFTNRKNADKYVKQNRDGLDWCYSVEREVLP